MLTPNVHYEKIRRHYRECEWNAKKLKSSHLVKKNSKGEWEVITEIYRRNKKKRKLEVIKFQD